jgi:DNA polymerase-3 subunit alpha (Gram-positive type)
MVWQDLIDTLPEELRLLLAGSEPAQVVVNPAAGSWRLSLRTLHILTARQLAEVAGMIRQHIPELRQVELLQQLTQAQELTEIVQRRRAEMEALCPRLPWPKISWRVRKDHLMLESADPDIYNAVLEQEASELLSRWLFTEYGLRLVVRIYLNSGLNTATDDYIDKDQPLNILAEAAPTAAEKRRRPVKTRWRSQKALPLSEVMESTADVVAAGQVFDKNTLLLRNGRLTVTYYLTDHADSLIVRRYLNSGAADRIQTGDWIKVTGYVRYDRYLKEITLVAQDYMVMDCPTTRRDQCEEKRVELHAHTTMSKMDGLTDTEALINRAVSWGHSAIAITDHGVVQAFPLAQKAAKGKDIKVIYGMEGYLVEEDKKDRGYHIILLAANQTGLQNLYELISQSFLENFYRNPKLLRRQIMERREGLLLGSACVAGELFQALLQGADAESIQRIVDFYDYLEIQPKGNNAFLLQEGQLPDEAALEALTARIVALGRAAGKPVAATGDVHFLEPEHQIFRTIIQAGQGYANTEMPAPLYFRTTEEMLAEFAFLGEDDARWTVCTSPAQIAARIEALQPIPEGFYPPEIDTAEQEVQELTWATARAVYGREGGVLPEVVRARVQHELDSIIGHQFSVLYLIAHKLVKKSNADGYVVGSRGSVGSSLVAFLMGITEVNSLKPHYLCPYCHYFAEDDTGIYGCGSDLPERDCPECGAPLGRHGFDIPFETFLGFEGDKVPDIDLNFSGDYQSTAHHYVEEIFGAENVFRAGTIATVADKTAFGFLHKYCEEQNLILKKSEETRLTKSITGVRRTTGQHPGGIIVVPRGHRITEFTPIQYPADDKEKGVITTHFEYHAMEDQLVKLDILGHDDPTVIRALEDMTGVSAASVSLSDPVTMQLFSGLEPLGVTEEAIDSRVGTFGIPEFGTGFVRKMLEVTQPATFAELVRISGLSHGTDVWSNNAEVLIKDNVATLKEAICTRDDIMLFLISQGMADKPAFDIMERVRKGKGLTGDHVALMREIGIPEWYITSCNKIQYMFPKAHAVAYVTMAYRIAWYKIHEPLAFYSSYFTVRAANDFELETVLQGYEAIKRRLKELTKLINDYQATDKDKKIVPVLEVALEMLARGFAFYPPDILASDASVYKIRDQGLLIPFAAFPNMGESACGALISARSERPFISVEDFQNRGHVNKTVIEIMRGYGCLDDLPETTQIDMFSK